MDARQGVSDDQMADLEQLSKAAQSRSLSAEEELAAKRCVHGEKPDLPGVISDRLEMQECCPGFRLRVFPLGQGQVLVTTNQLVHVNEVFRSAQHPVS